MKHPGRNWMIAAVVIAMGVVSSSAVTSAQTPVLYGVNSEDDGLSIIDLAYPNTGKVTFVGPLDPVLNKPATPVAMAVHPWYKTLYVWNNSDEDTPPETVTGVLLTVDPCTGAATPVNSGFATGQEIGALAFDTAGNLFGLGRLAEDTTQFGLFDIDITTGSITLLEEFKEDVGGELKRVLPPIAGADFFDPSGKLYALELVPHHQVDVRTPNLYRISINYDSLSGSPISASIEGSWALDTFVGTAGSIVFDASGTLFGSGFGGPSGNVLYKINSGTGLVYDIMPITGGEAPQGMGFAPSCPQILIPDQVCDSIYVEMVSCEPNPGWAHLMQSFTPEVSPLAAVDLFLRAYPPEGQFTTVHIRSGSPNGPSVGTANTFIPGPLTSGTNLWVRFEFDPPINVIPGETYYLQWDASSTPMFRWWRAYEGENYVGGAAYSCCYNPSGCTGAPVSGHDYLFITYTSNETATNTESGTGVVTELTDTDTSPAIDVTLTFDQVTAAGATIMDISEEGPPAPEGFQLGDPPTYYDITTTAVYSGQVRVCINYRDVSYYFEPDLKLSITILSAAAGRTSPSPSTPQTKSSAGWCLPYLPSPFSSL